MYTIGFSYRRLSIWIFILIQVVIVISYFFFQMDRVIDDGLNGDKITFLASKSGVSDLSKSYHTIKNRIILPLVNTRKSFIDFNSSLCYVNGTDLKSMKRSKTLNWKCQCLPSWHGIDCGQPEVIWRAILTHHRRVSVKGPKVYERRIIYLFKVDELTETIADIRINELGDVVDLFVLYENEDADFLERKLNNQFNKHFHRKILYLKSNSDEDLLQLVRRSVKNLQSEDLILFSGAKEIHNRLVLDFLKNYDGWPEPVLFRMRWSVYGFFWKHPSKTVITGGASTVAYLKNTSNYNIDYLKNKKASIQNKAIIFGDLNHYGGWYCEYCNDPMKIVMLLSSEGTTNPVLWDKINKDKIDDSYIEELIENGVYVDGKTELERARKYQDNYFAPKYVIDSYKYDFLMINFYTKLDYYDG